MMLSLNNLQNIIYNPVIPYFFFFPDQLDPGTLIVIRGHVPSDADRFQVDLQYGSSVKPRADVAFHFNPRFKRAGCIVCNTLINFFFGREEITYDTPFKREKSFFFFIMVLKDKFQVVFNGKHTLLYGHRIGTEKIFFFGIYGKVNIHSIGFRFSSDLQSTQASGLELTEVPKSGTPFFFCIFAWTLEGSFIHSIPYCRTFFFQPSNRGDISKIVPRTVYFFFKDSTVNHSLTCTKIPPMNYVSKSLPFFFFLNTPMGPGRTVVVKGEVFFFSKSFNFFFLAGKSKDIALHLNPRLNIKAFIRNSFLQESWGEEERNITSFPFSPGMYFEMIIYCDVREFKVAVNGVHSLEYKHRFKELSSIDTLEINGDIHLVEVRSW
ncbi:PREDICTED: galectin-8 [Cercocebus atys]|uniref:galectin-8 n=1 Tax=Cercocebus atys TaxID=9531 RepID=UPI0005F3ADC9|nr:PREDICTED: galectin-8 [Cercocebus atys]